MRKVFSKVALAAAAIMGVASSANAYVVLTVAQVGGTSLSCNSFLGGCGAGFTIVDANTVIFGGVVDNFRVTTTSATSNAPGNVDFATSDTSTTRVARTDTTSNVIKSLIIDLIAFDFFNPSGELKTFEGSSTPTSTIGFGSALESVFTNFRVNADNGSTVASFVGQPNFSCTYTPANPTQCFNAGNGVWSDLSTSQPGFSTRTQQVFNILGGTSINSSSSLTVRNVPEPLTLSLVGAAMLAVGVASRRKAKQ